MKKNFLSTPLVIATMAFAIVAFLFLIDTAINPNGSKKSTNTTTGNKNTNSVACTLEAKLCPDGSSVSRSGPNCEFAECPAYTGDDTTNWKTYSSEKEGYTMQYPPEYQVKEGAHEVLFKATGTNGIPGDTLSVSVYEGRSGCCGAYTKAMDTWARGGFKEFSWTREDTQEVYTGEFPPGYDNKKTIQIGDNSFTVFRVGSGMDSVNHYFLAKGSTVYSIHSSYYSNEKSNVDIISTFKFTNPTAGWKTYTAPTAKYSFRYPEGLGNAEIQGMMYLGGLDGEKAKDWEANLAVIDTDKETQILYIYAPVQSDEPSTTLTNLIPGAWKNSAQYTKSSRKIGETTFDKYVAVSTPDNNVREGYATTKAGRHYILSLMDAKIDLAQNIVSTFTISD